MSKVRPLSGEEARRTLAHRFAGRADRLRQLNTRFGLRPYHVTLVWTRWTGQERGQGREQPLAGGRIELLPTPKVVNLDQGIYQLLSGGALPVGSVRVTEISANYTMDQLVGLAVPTAEFTRENDPPHARSARELPPKPSLTDLPQPLDFHWEVREDGRGDELPPRWRFRLLSWPMRDAGKLQWVCTLERVSNDDDRDGVLNSGYDPQ